MIALLNANDFISSSFCSSRINYFSWNIQGLLIRFDCSIFKVLQEVLFSSFIITALSDSFNIISYFQAFVNTFFEFFSKSFFRPARPYPLSFVSVLYYTTSFLSCQYLFSTFLKKVFWVSVVFIANPLELTLLLYHSCRFLSILFLKKFTFV